MSQRMEKMENMIENLAETVQRIYFRLESSTGMIWGSRIVRHRSQKDQESDNRLQQHWRKKYEDKDELRLFDKEIVAYVTI